MSPGHLESARHRAGWWNPAASVTRPPGSCTPSPVWGPRRPRRTFPFFLRRPRPLLPTLAPLGCRCCLDSARGAGRGRGPSCGCGAGASAKPAGRGWQHCAGAVGRGRPRRGHRLCGFGVSPKPSSLSPSGPRRLSLRHTCCQPAAQGRPTLLFAWSASPRALYVTPPQWFMAAFPFSPWQNYRPGVQDKTGENGSQEQPVKQRLARTKEYSNRANFLKSKQTPKGVPCFTLFKVMGEFFTKNISNTPCLKLGDKLYNTSVLTHR